MLLETVLMAEVGHLIVKNGLRHIRFDGGVAYNEKKNYSYYLYYNSIISFMFRRDYV